MINGKFDTPGTIALIVRIEEIGYLTTMYWAQRGANSWIANTSKGILEFETDEVLAWIPDEDSADEAAMSDDYWGSIVAAFDVDEEFDKE